MSGEQWKGKKALVIGLGISGRAAADFLIALGAHVTGVDQKSERLNLLPFKTHLDDVHLNIKDFDLVVPSPGVPPSHPYYQSALKEGVPIMGEIELGLSHVNQKVLGITGTNGKTTVTLLVAHVLNASGLKAVALGNVGTPLTAEILQNPDPDAIFVVELSSYQIETLKCRALDAGAILNITPDHLDRYGTMENYAKAKIDLKNCLKPNAKLYVEAKTYQEYLSLFEGFEPETYGYTKDNAYYTDLQDVFEHGLKAFSILKQYQGRESHEIENMLAAFALCRVCGISGKQFLEAFLHFQKPKHRIEFVATIDGVRFYDDSKGTNIDAVMRAVTSLEGDIILIAGGVDKGASYLPWVDAFKGRVKSIVAIGEAASKLYQELSPFIPVELAKTLEAAVRRAKDLSRPGQIVLLSPGCSSLDMFKDYAERGREFQKFAKSLIHTEKNYDLKELHT